MAFHKLFAFFCLFSLSFSMTDPSSFSNYDQIKQTHLEVNFEVNFEENLIYVTEKLHLNALKDGEVIILDTDFIEIDSVIDSNTGESVDFILDDLYKLTPLGTPLKIFFSYKKGENISLLIKSKTHGGNAVQFLSKEQTLGKQYPFMFTQCESILARTLLPIQDTPDVKFTVAASIRVPKPLVGVYAGIFQSKLEEDKTITYFYEQNVKIPSYLIAFAAGAIEERIMSSRVKMYGEKEIVNQAAIELDETERFIQVVESYISDYEWGEYNLLVLPPSFPFGGMENPCLTFVTPTIIAGDKSLSAVVAHEISHSWSGNLVTMARWSSFWLNEGFTMFLQRKIIQTLYGDDRMKINAASGVKLLREEVGAMGKSREFTKLEMNIIGRSPEEAVSMIPYEKGYNFLYSLESMINSYSNRDIFKLILQDYFKAFAFQSIEYTQMMESFKNSINKYLPEKAKEIESKIDWNYWLFTPGIPKYENDFTNKLSEQADDNLNALKNNSLTSDKFKPIFDGWHSDVKEYFLKEVAAFPSPLSDSQYKILSDDMGLAKGYNADITSDFFVIMLKNKKLDKINELDEFLGKYGRLKYLKPLYSSLASFNKPKAKEIFNKHKSGYHPIAVGQIEKIIKVA